MVRITAHPGAIKSLKCFVVRLRRPLCLDACPCALRRKPHLDDFRRVSPLAHHTFQAWRQLGL
jgi:hypothetical protein